MNISAVVMAYNEEENIPGLIESLKGVADIVLVDHESIDDTKRIAEELGCTVITKQNMVDRPTQEDRENFIATYHYKPTFTTDNLFFNGAADQNYGASLAKHDWVFYPDCDERVKWDIEEIEKLLPTCDQSDIRFTTLPQ
jgi:glycosyltransferase involved in cell wall biosynthesis